MSAALISNPISYAMSQVMEQALNTGLFTSLCQIKNPPTAVDAVGRPTSSNPANWTAAPLYGTGAGRLIKCMSAPKATESLRGSTEVKSTDRTGQKQERHVLLEAYYPTIVKSQRAVIDGVNFDITGVENDSQAQMTRLEVQEYSL